jgi:hypothetical protein
MTRNGMRRVADGVVTTQLPAMPICDAIEARVRPLLASLGSDGSP